MTLTMMCLSLGLYTIPNAEDHDFSESSAKHSCVDYGLQPTVLATGF